MPELDEGAGYRTGRLPADELRLRRLAYWLRAVTFKPANKF